MRLTVGQLAPIAKDEASSAPSLSDRFKSVRRRSMELAAPLSAEDQVVQSMPDASPTKWHLAHTTWFFETMVLERSEAYRPFDPSYGFLFNSYYEVAGPRQPRALRGLITRPSVDEVAAYRRHVDSAVLDSLATGAVDEVGLSLLTLGLFHEEQHQELLLSDALHLLAQNPLRPAYRPVTPPACSTAAKLAFVPIKGGLIEIGRDAPSEAWPEAFAFDNEGPRHKIYLQPFQLADRLVSNAEWLAFIQAGGYRRPDLWLSDGWARVQADSWSAPLYWEQHGDAWSEFGLGGLVPLQEPAPVRHVSYYEADAYARWCGARLPTEAEWEHAALQCRASFSGLDDEVWQWTSSPYVAYPGFREAAGKVSEYNGKFMVNQMVLRGASFATPSGHAGVSYRNFYQPHQRWQFGGVRLAKDGGTAPAPALHEAAE